MDEHTRTMVTAMSQKTNAPGGELKNLAKGLWGGVGASEGARLGVDFGFQALEGTRSRQRA